MYAKLGIFPRIVFENRAPDLTTAYVSTSVASY